mgnify:FL=1
MLGWNICKVWTLDWWEDSQKVIDHIEAELKRAECGKSQRSVPVISLASGSGEVQKEGLLCHAQHCLVKLPEQVIREEVKTASPEIYEKNSSKLCKCICLGIDDATPGAPYQKTIE